MQERRPYDGDHTQHPSGTAEQDTLRTWVFSVNASVSVRRKAIEQHGGKSETFVGVLTTVVSLDCSDEAAQSGCKSGCGKPVCGESIMWNHHESNRGKVG